MARSGLRWLPLMLVAIYCFRVADCTYFYIGLLGRDSVDEVQFQFSEPVTANVLSNNNDCPSLPAEHGPTDSFTVSECLASLAPVGTQLADKGVAVSTDVDSDRLQVSVKASGVAEAFHVLPLDDLGTEYVVITMCDFGGICQFSVVATEDGTSVLVTFPPAVNAAGICSSSGGSPTGQSVPFQLDKLQVLQIESDNDLSGTVITSTTTTKKIAVFAGARNVPSADASQTANYMEQLIPTEKFGTEFIFVPSQDNPAGDELKIVTVLAPTTLRITGMSPILVSEPLQVVQRRIDWGAFTRVVTSNPVIAAQFTSVDLYNDTADVTGTPSMMLLPATSHFTNNYVMRCHDPAAVPAVYLVRSSTSDDSSITFTPSPVNPGEAWSYVSWSDYSVVRRQFPVASTVTIGTIASQSGVFGAYGYCEHSSSFLLGLDLSTTVNSGCSPTLMTPGDLTDNDCDGEIDEDDCSVGDKVTSFSFTSHPSDAEFIDVSGTDRITFSFRSCAMGVLALRGTGEAYYMIELTPKRATVYYCSPECGIDDDETFNPDRSANCENTNYEFWLTWTNANLELGTGRLYSSVDRIVQTPMTAITVQWLLFSTYEGDTFFDVDWSSKDCDRIFSGDPDTFGKQFAVPFDVSDDVIVIMTAFESASVTLTNMATGDSVAQSVAAAKTEAKTKSDLNNPTTWVLIESDKEIAVQVINLKNNYQTEYTVLPSDTLGVHYVALTPDKPEGASSFSAGCSVISLGSSATVTTRRRLTDDVDDLELTLLPYGMEPILVATEDISGSTIETTAPVAVFCWVAVDDNYLTMQQMPPVETLGEEIYIPAIDLATLPLTAYLKVVTTEDSTHVWVSGDYDEETLEANHGDSYTRPLETDTNYTITANKGVLVALVMEKTTEAGFLTFILIPPKVQYFNASYLRGTVITMDNPFTASTSQSGTFTSGAGFTWNNPDPELKTGSENMFHIFIGMKTQKFYLTSGGMMLATVNVVCVVSTGFPGDGIDNDCDGLVDEEFCYSVNEAGLIDYDIDGVRCEDTQIHDNSVTLTTVVEIKMNQPASTLTCDSGSPASTIATPPDWTPPMDGGSSGGSSARQTTPTFGAPPTLAPPVTFASGGGANPSPTSTAAPSTTAATKKECFLDCIAPCAWATPQNLTLEQIQEKVAEIQARNKVDTKKLSATIRKKISVEDNRPAAVGIGYVGIIFLGLTIGFLVVLDFTTMLRDVRMLLDNLRNMFQH